MKKLILITQLTFFFAISAFSQIKLKKEDFIFSDTTSNNFINNYYKGGFIEMVYTATEDMPKCKISVFLGKTEISVYLIDGLKKGQKHTAIVKLTK